MNRSQRFYKKEINKISLSSSFMARCRCSQCGSTPVIYYYINNAPPFNDPKSLQIMFAIITKRVRKMGSDHYLDDDPRDYHSLGDFSQKSGFKKFDPKLHHLRGLNTDMNVTEFLMCKCGHTTLAFNQKSIKNRLEVLHRKSHKYYPQKFVY